MVGAFSSNAGRPSPGSWLANRLERSRPHPDSFVCGVRVLEGTVTGETARWRYRRSAVDRLRADGVVTLHHGIGHTVRLRMDSEPVWDGSGPRPRTGFVAMTAVDADGGGRVLLAVPVGEVAWFGVDVA